MDGNKLRDARKASGLTMRQISIESGITEGQIRNLETGHTKDPRVSTVTKLAQVLGCDLAALLA